MTEKSINEGPSRLTRLGFNEGGETEEKEMKLKMSKSFEYGAVGVCSIGGNTRLYYRFNYVFFMCNFDSYGMSETSITVFDRNDEKLTKKAKNGFKYRNPSDLIHHKISSKEEDLNL